MLRKAYLSLMLLFLLPTLCSAQLGGLMKGHNQKPATPSDKAPEYSDADKAEMAKIAERPEVQEEIQKEWDKKRLDDMRTAYFINQTASWGLTEDPINHPGMKMEDFAGYDRLYSNPMTQLYINNIGQHLVPKDSPNPYAFRILLDPIPKAFSLSTGSIYISTGLLALLDSEAQLSYILAHEVAHVEQKHEYKQIRNKTLQDELNKAKEAKAERTKEAIALGGALAGGLLGGIGGKGGGFTSTALAAVAGAGGGGALGLLAGNLFIHPKLEETEWSVIDENEADEYGAKYMLDQGYDVREVPRLYVSLDRIVSKDQKVGLGFMGDPRRVKQRTGHIQQLIAGDLKPKLDKLVASNGVTGSGTEFPVLISAARRDNAIIAMQYDLFAEARQNLEDALAQRSNDPSVHFYLSRVEALTARTPEEKREAVSHITQAITLDAARGAIPDLHLEMAISLLDQSNSANKAQIINELKTYVTLYQRDNAGALPGNMSAIFDYFNLVGETGWYLPPEWYPATQLMNTSAPTIAPATTVHKALVAGGGDSAAPTASADTAAPVKVRQTSGNRK
jgi:predicted Zn-dependent protease